MVQFWFYTAVSVCPDAVSTKSDYSERGLYQSLKQNGKVQQWRLQKIIQVQFKLAQNPQPDSDATTPNTCDELVT